MASRYRNMVSSTRQSETRRAMNKKRAGRKNKKERTKAATPKFPIQPPGYDQKAADAKKSTN